MDKVPPRGPADTEPAPDDIPTPAIEIGPIPAGKSAARGHDGVRRRGQSARGDRERGDDARGDGDRVRESARRGRKVDRNGAAGTRAPASCRPPVTRAMMRS